jgi:hypothetical protein
MGLMVARRLVLAVLVVVCALVGVVGLTATPVLAFQTHVLEGDLGPDGTSATEYFYPWSLGLDQSTGDVYVASLDNVVRKFDSAHKLLPFPGVSFGYSEQGTQLAVNSTSLKTASHDLYVVGGSPGVRAFQSDGEPADFSAGPGAGSNEITGSEVCGVAVDANGAIYVSESGTGIRIFKEDGQAITTIPASGACNIAVDPNGILYLDYRNGPVEKLVPSEFPVTSSTLYASAGTVDPNPSLTVAVNPSSDHLYVDEGSQIAEYDETGSPLGTFGAGGPSALRGSVGLAVYGASGQVYVSNSEGAARQVEVFGPAILVPDVTTGKAGEINPKGSATLNGAVNPDGVEVSECYFEYGTSAAYSQAAACEQTVGSGNGEVAVTAKLTKLTAGATYHFRLVASNKTVLNKSPANYGSDETFPIPPRPAIDATSTSNLASSSVDLDAEINPGGVEVSECYFEYGTSTSYGHTVACEQTVGSGTSDVAISGHVEGLSPNVTYHWRVVASSAAGTTTGVDHTFVYGNGGEGLPDNRAYEMVTPPHKNAALIGQVLLGIPPVIAENGSRLIMSSIQCFAGAESCTGSRQTEGEQFLFSRTSAGWTTTALAPPATQFEANSSWEADAETGMELFSMPTPPFSEDDFYVREPDGSFVDVGPATPPAGGAQGEPWGSQTIVATSDFSHIVFQEGGIWPFTQGTEDTLYEYSGTANSAPTLVGVSGGLGATDLISRCNTELGEISNGVHPGEMSANGETVYFTAEPCESGTGDNAKNLVPVDEIYARIGDARTVAISEPQALTSGSRDECESTECIKNTERPPSPAVNPNWRSASFTGASDDGSKAFFESEQQLTDHAGQDEGDNLYESECDVGCEGSENEEKRSLIDASEAAGGTKAPGGARVQGVLAISTDGSHVYFVAQGVLTVVPNMEGKAAKDGADNLYVFERDAEHPSGQVEFVAQLSESDAQAEWSGNDGSGVANVTPNGRFLVFESKADLTLDDTRTNGARQVFRYDAQTGELTRISIGERGFNDDGNAGVGDATIVSAVQGQIGAGASRSDPTMSDDGSFVFFESPVGLTPHGLNDVLINTVEYPYEKRIEPIYAQNIYEWHEGHVYLISDGRDTALRDSAQSATALLGSDATGSNVFIYTADPLVAQDTDTQVDVYDARICTISEPCIGQPPPLPPCLGEACHGTPASQLAPPTGGTLTLNGIGNVNKPAVGTAKKSKSKGEAVVKCARGKRRVRGKCVKANVKRRKTSKAKSHKGAK